MLFRAKKGGRPRFTLHRVLLLTTTIGSVTECDLPLAGLMRLMG
jgi:hypothetical protein